MAFRMQICKYPCSVRERVLSIPTSTIAQIPFAAAYEPQDSENPKLLIGSLDCGLNRPLMR